MTALIVTAVLSLHTAQHAVRTVESARAPAGSTHVSVSGCRRWSRTRIDCSVITTTRAPELLTVLTVRVRVTLERHGVIRVHDLEDPTVSETQTLGEGGQR